MCNAGAIAAVGVVGSLVSGVSSYNTAQSNAKASDYESQIYSQNAQTAVNNAVNERQAGYDEAHKIEQETGAKASQQKAAIAASGMDASEGTAVDLVDTTKYYGEMDALTTVKNSQYKADAYMAEAQNYSMNSSLASQTANNYRNSSWLTALGTTATGLGQVGSSWYNWTKTGTALGGSKGASNGSP